VLVGVAGGELGIRGFIAAYHVETGKEMWRFYTIPGPGEKGHDTWAGDSWKTGGAPVWVTGSYDPTLNLTYWGVGNPGPDFNPAQREGQNLYASSVVALDADSGKLRWHFQFTPGDPYDYDATQIPVLVDADWDGRPRKLMYWANRNGFFYVLDRETGRFLAGYPFTKVTWARGLDANGAPLMSILPSGTPITPGPVGATNWYSPSYSPRTGLFYFSIWEDYSVIFMPAETPYKEGQRFMGGRTRSPNAPGAANVPFTRRSPINTWTEAAGRGATIALDPRTGQRKWTFPMTDVATSGVLTTVTDVLFTGSREGYFHAMDARTGAVLWKVALGGQVAQGPMTYAVNGKQYVAVAAGNGMFVFGLRE
jgi:alcohol dehydrogenase (cytochrome c)